MKDKTDERLNKVKIKYGKTNINDKKFMLPILELLKECEASVPKKREKMLK